MDKLQCKYCGFQYKTKPASTMIEHECNDEEWHFISRKDLTEKPLKELRHEVIYKYKDYG